MTMTGRRSRRCSRSSCRSGRRPRRRSPLRRLAGWRPSAGGSTSSAQRTRSRSTNTPSCGRGSSRSRRRAPTCARRSPGRGADRRAERDDRRPVPDDVPGARGGLRCPLPAALRRRLRAARPDRSRGPGRDRRRDRGPAAGQEGAGPGDAVRRRARADRGRPPVRDARGPAGPVLRPRRGRRGPRRGERRALLRRPCGASRLDPVHRHHPQPRHDRGGRCAVRRHRRRRLGQPGDQPPPRRGDGDRGRLPGMAPARSTRWLARRCSGGAGRRTRQGRRPMASVCPGRRA